MHITRRKLIRSAARSAGRPRHRALGCRQRSTVHHSHMGIDAPPTEPFVETNAAGEKIKARTNGAVEFSMFPSSALGAGTDMIAPVRSGAVEEYFFTSRCSRLSRRTAISGMPLAFKLSDGMGGARRRSRRPDQNRNPRSAGLEPMAKVFDIGFRQIATQKQIDSVDNLAGIKMRVPQSPLYVGLFRALGVLPATMNFADVYPALQTGGRGGGWGTIIGIYSYSKVIKGSRKVPCDDRYHMWDGFWLTINPAFWNKLSQQQRDIVTEELGLAAVRMRRENRQSRGAGSVRSESRGDDGHPLPTWRRSGRSWNWMLASAKSGKASSSPKCGWRWNESSGQSM